MQIVPLKIKYLVATKIPCLLLELHCVIIICVFSFITGRGSGVRYSGLYAYFVTEKQWVCIQPDLITQPYSYPLMPRMAHSMLLDSVSGLFCVVCLWSVCIYNVVPLL